MSWVEVSPGRWERPFGNNEKIPLVMSKLELVPGRENWYESSISKILIRESVGEPEQALRQAWKQVRFQFPEIAAYPSGDKYVYEVPQTEEEVTKWLSSTCSTVTTTADELLTSLPPLNVMSVHWIPHTSEVVLTSSHFRLDGRAFMTLSNFICHALAQPKQIDFGNEVSNLSPSFEVLAKIPQAPYSPEIETAATQRLMAWGSSLPPVKIATSFSAGEKAAVSRRLTSVYSIEETSSMVKACKSNNLSVAVALTAGLVSACCELAEPAPVDESRYFMAICAFDLRKYNSSPTTSTATISSTGNVYPITVTDGSFDSHAAQFKEIFQRGFDPYIESMSCFQEMMMNLVNQSLPHDSPLNWHPVLSSLGKADNIMESQFFNERGEVAVELEDFWVGMEIHQCQPQLFVWTLHGQLTMTACYNEAYWSPEGIQQLLDKIKQHVQQGLNLDS
ncbi:hypothetical protein EYB25_008029 [Talaromyces marneffei]|uniref:3-phosphoshikimate 1-carboxyvinyltransferase, chloroplastic n=1 Tax=Talaromyces marneffei PM1 TaxID=1077442 RepID=A0A093XRA9_TALMA|nr:hypothetical protein EYB25_008029 [Talaromyces marneffei]